MCSTKNDSEMLKYTFEFKLITKLDVFKSEPRSRPTNNMKLHLGLTLHGQCHVNVLAGSKTTCNSASACV